MSVENVLFFFGGRHFITGFLSLTFLYKREKKTISFVRERERERLNDLLEA